MGDELEEVMRKFTSAAASSFSELGVSTERAANYTPNSSYPVYPKYTPNSSYPVYPKYTPEQLVEKLVKAVKDSDLDDDELRALVGEIITSVTNQLYEIIKERES